MLNKDVNPYLNYFKFFSSLFIYFTCYFKAFGFLELFYSFNSPDPVVTVNHQVMTIGCKIISMVFQGSLNLFDYKFFLASFGYCFPDRNDFNFNFLCNLFVVLISFIGYSCLECAKNLLEYLLNKIFIIFLNSYLG